MSSNVPDLEELLFTNEELKDCLIAIKYIKGNKDFLFLGKKSVDKFLTDILSYRKTAIITNEEISENEEILHETEIWIYKGNDASWIICYFISLQERFELYTTDNKNKLNVTINLLLPIFVEINYEEKISDITDKFLSLFKMYPKLKIIRLSYEEENLEEENYYNYNRKYKDFLERKKKLNFLTYLETFRLEKLIYKDFEIVNPISVLNHRF